MSTSAFRQTTPETGARRSEEASGVYQPTLPETVSFMDMPLADLVRCLRTLAVERPTFDPAETVTMTGRQLLALAERLARSAR